MAFHGTSKAVCTAQIKKVLQGASEEWHGPLLSFSSPTVGQDGYDVGEALQIWTNLETQEQGKLGNPKRANKGKKEKSTERKEELGKGTNRSHP